MSATKQSGGGGVQASTLLVASVSSATAAIIVGQLWRPGAIIGAAVTPIIVALTSELLRRQAQTVSAVRTRRPPGEGPARRARGPRGAEPAEPPPAPPREDRFGIWAADDPSRGRDRRRRNLRLAVLTGLVAFVIGAVALTTGELVLGGSVGGGERTTVFGGRESDRDEGRDEERDAQEQPGTDGDAAPAPDETDDGEPPGQTPTTTTPTPTTTTPTTTTPTTTTTTPTAPVPPPGGQPPPG